MGRPKTIRSIDAKIEAVKGKIQKAKKRYDNLCNELIELQQQRDEVMAHEILVALKASGKSCQELMTFLGRWAHRLAIEWQFYGKLRLILLLKTFIHLLKPNLFLKL